MICSARPEPALDLPRVSLFHGRRAYWTADGHRVVISGWEKGRPVRSYVVEPSGGQPRPITPEGTECRGATGRKLLPCFRRESDKQGRATLVWELRSLETGQPQPVPWIGPNEVVMSWSVDDRYAFLAVDEDPHLRVARVDVATGHREPWLDMGPLDLGTHSLATASLSPDGRSYAYSYCRTLNDLFLVEGLR